MRQCFDAGAEGGGELLAPRGAERGQHLLFDGVDGLVAGAEGRVAFMGEVCLQDAAVDRMRPAGLAAQITHSGAERIARPTTKLALISDTCALARPVAVAERRGRSGSQAA